MPTFADLGIPFPLFEAPTTEASYYVGIAACNLCGAEGRHCFGLGGGDELSLPCPACGVENCSFKGGPKDCRECGATVPFPEVSRDENRPLACYDCVRAGKTAMTKMTEFGMVSWDQAVEGVTHGESGLRTDQFEVVPIDPDEDWYGVRVPHEHLWELLRTPGFNSWQGECWLFCCRRPMAYLGGWRNAVESIRPDDPTAFYKSLFDPDDEARDWDSEVFASGSPSLYVYRCLECGRFRSTQDCD